jgi:Ser/Thr protein kinase RdoA (MazF antagonist)
MAAVPERGSGRDWGDVLADLDHGTTVPEAVAQWGGQPASIRLVSEGVNIVFRFELDGEGRFLRFAHDCLIAKHRVEAAVDFLSHVAREGAPVCQPVASHAGRLVEVMPNDRGNWLATVTAEAPGHVLGSESREPAACEAWGRSLGLLHQAAETYRPTESGGFQRWQDIWDGVKERINPQDTLAVAEFERLDAWLATVPPPSDPHPDFGLTHGDFRAGNALWDSRSRQITVIDFDEPHRDWFAADVARAFLEFVRRPREQRLALQAWFLRGYRSARCFPDFWEGNIAYFIRLRALDAYTWHDVDLTAQEQSVPDEDDAAVGSDFVRFLRRRFAHPGLWH